MRNTLQVFSIHRLWFGAALLAGLPFIASAQQPPQLLRSYSAPGIGFAVADMPDLDGDGRRDFITGAQRTGTVAAWSTTRDAALWSASPGLASLGWSVAAAGDINRDGVSDVIAGGRNAPSGGAVMLLSGRDGAQLASLVPSPGTFGFGSAVSGLDDLDGDGVPELLAGASSSAVALVFSGANGAILRTHDSAPGTEFGAGAARLGDLNGDGVGEYVIGAPSDAPGRAFVYSGASGQLLYTLTADALGRFGEFFVANAGDVNADGRSDVYVGAYTEGAGGAAYVFSGRTGNRLFRLAGTQSEGMGPGRSAGDVNGDGHADLIIGSYTFSGAGLGQGGRVRVFSGADQSVLVTINGARPGAQFGFDAVGIGDVTGDGALDFLISSPPGNFADVYAGSIVVNSLDVTGAWFNPAQDGHGLLLEQLPDNTVLASWFTYDPAGSGAQRWFFGTGAIANGIAQINVFDITGIGARFIPNWQSGATTQRPLGQLRIQFASCSGARIDYELNAPYGTGSFPMQRLSTPNGVACGSAAIASGAIHGMTGAWFDPAQSGHGLLVENLADGNVLATWYTFDQNGQPAWILGTGRIENGVAVLRAERTQGGRFVDGFNPTTVQRSTIGELRLSMTSCSRGRVDYTLGTAFGTGSMTLTRLTQPRGLGCR